MRIGIDARFYGSVGKGLGRYTEKLIEHLERIDTHNDYVIFLRRENFDEYVPNNPRFKKVLAHYPWYSISEQLCFPFVLLSFRLDLMHFPHFNVPRLYLKRFVVTIHDLILLHHPTMKNTTRVALLYWLKFLAYRYVIASALRRAKCVIAVSHFTEHDILAQYPVARGKVVVTYEATDRVCRVLPPEKEYALFQKLGLIQETGKTQQALRDILIPYCLYVGNAYPHKNLEAILGLALKFPQCVFVYVGKEDYFYARLKNKVREKRATNVVFAGFLDDQELNTLYRFAQSYLFPSLYEGFGLPPLEAMACGTPVIAARAGALPEVLGDAAVYFDPQQQDSFAQALRSILGSEEQRKALIERGYQQVARYDWHRMARETLTLYTTSVKTKHTTKQHVSSSSQHEISSHR